MSRERAASRTCTGDVDLSRYWNYRYSAFVSSCTRHLETCSPLTANVVMTVDDGVGGVNAYRSGFYRGVKTSVNQRIASTAKSTATSCG